MSNRQIVSLLTALGFLFGAVYPKPIMIKATQKPHPYQILARLCLAALGLLILWITFSK